VYAPVPEPPVAAKLNELDHGRGPPGGVTLTVDCVIFVTATITAEEVSVTELEPEREPDTCTERASPISAGATTYVDQIAPAMGVPLRSHWYRSVVLLSHDPVVVVRVAPSTGVPVMVGIGVGAMVPSGTGCTSTNGMNDGRRPGTAAVTCTASVLPPMLGVIASELPSCEDRTVPFINQL
jgi:hypothetical protein